MALLVGKVMRLFSLLYIAASRTVHVHYFCVCIVSCHLWGGGGGGGGGYFLTRYL